MVAAPPVLSDMSEVEGIASHQMTLVDARGAASGADSLKAAQAPPPPPSDNAEHAWTVEGLPIIKPPYSTITAIDLDSGEIKWQIPHGETPDVVRNSPALKGMQIPRTGQTSYNIGTLLTKSLVMAGASMETP